MEIKFIGTGAADYIGDKPERHFTSTLVEAVLVDASPRIWDALAGAAVAPESVRHVIFTHSHKDHYNDQTVASFDKGLPKLQSVSASTVLTQRIQAQCPQPRWSRNSLSPGQKIRLDDLEWESFRANHPTVDQPEIPLNYRVSDGKHHILVFNDTALPHLETVRALSQGPAAHALLMDATMGLIDDDFRMFEHSSIQQVSRVASCWREMGILRPDAVVICNHLARTLLERNPPSEEILQELGVRLAPEKGTLQLSDKGWHLHNCNGTPIGEGSFAISSGTVS